MESPENDSTCFPPFPHTLEIARTRHRNMKGMRSDFHIPSAPAASMNQFQNTKGQNPLRLPFATFRLIFRLEKTLGPSCPWGSTRFLHSDHPHRQTDPEQSDEQCLCQAEIEMRSPEIDVGHRISRHPKGEQHLIYAGNSGQCQDNKSDCSADNSASRPHRPSQRENG